MKRKPSQQALGVVIGLMLVLAAASAYFLLISPQNSKASDLKKQSAAVREEIVRLRALTQQVQQTEPIRVADLFRMTKAMPSEADMPGIILQLNRIARETGIRFDSITPQAPAEANGAQAIPINLVFQGNYFELADFLFRLRRGTLDATGRLFVVSSVSFAEGEKKFPQIQATLTVAAYVYGSTASAGAAAAAPAPATPPASPAPASPDTPPTTPGPSAAPATP